MYPGYNAHSVFMVLEIRHKVVSMLSKWCIVLLKSIVVCLLFSYCFMCVFPHQYFPHTKVQLVHFNTYQEACIAACVTTHDGCIGGCRPLPCVSTDTVNICMEFCLSWDSLVQQHTRGLRGASESLWV